jgi:GT2 family glycosyltransferase
MRMTVLPARTFKPRRARPDSVRTWLGHLPFANDLIATFRPSLLVELGTHYGESYFGMCQAVQENAVACMCYAIDTWEGDQHAGYYDESVFEEVNRYNEDNYASFSKLLRTTFDAAQHDFGDGTVDLLHIDGLHTYDAVRHDFETWFPKVRSGGVVLIHDIAARHADFQVWKLWHELAPQFPHLEFNHSWGLGVIRKPGGSAADSGFVQTVFSGSRPDQNFLRHYYALQAEILEQAHLVARASGSPAETLLQVFPSLANGYSEATSAAMTLRFGEWQQVVLKLPRGSGTGRIRVDPADRPCVVELASVVLRRGLDGSVVKSWTDASDIRAFSPIADLVLLPGNDGTRFLSTGNDPQFLLPEIDRALADQPLVFEARVRIVGDLGPAAALLHPAADAVERDAPLFAASSGRLDQPCLDARAARGRTAAGKRLPVSIVIPAFGAASQLADCLESLCRHAPPGCEVLVADDATPDDSVSEAAKSFQSKLSLTYVRRPDGLGFVENCNEAIRTILPDGNDVLLLNSDTRVTPGFLEEMWEVLHLHEKHGAVSPRSNNASIFSVPVRERLTPEDAYQLWRSIRFLLPRYQVMPTTVGFCMLIKNVVLRQLGLFDPAYSPGYNEENDFICRINRHGYSAVAAHRAFVFHQESSSFGRRRKVLERRNRRLLDVRYPEYSRKVAEYLRYGVDPIDHFAVLLRAHRRKILFDLFHLSSRRSETSDVALSLVLHLAPLLEPHCDLSLGLSEEARQFFSDELTGFRFYDAAREAESRFDVVFRPSQIFTWPELHRMVRLGGRIACTYLDTSAVRSSYLGGPGTRALFKTVAQLSDRVMTIGELSRDDFADCYGLAVPFEVIHLGTPEAGSVPARPRITSDPLVAAPSESPLGNWGDVAGQYARSLIDLLGRDLDIGLIRRRWEILTTIDALHPARRWEDATTEKPRSHARSLHVYESTLERLRRP